jgi:hypothetical protein
MDDGTGRHADVSAGLVAAKTDREQFAKHAFAGFVEDARTAAGTPRGRWLKRRSC